MTQEMLMNLKPCKTLMSPSLCSVLKTFLKLEMIENAEINFQTQSILQADIKSKILQKLKKLQ